MSAISSESRGRPRCTAKLPAFSLLHQWDGIRCRRNLLPGDCHLFPQFFIRAGITDDYTGTLDFFALSSLESGCD